MAEEMSTHAIARALRIPRSTVRNTLQSAFSKLRKDEVLRGLLESMDYEEHQRSVRSSYTLSRIKEYLR
jgi:hypothetical protein